MRGEISGRGGGVNGPWMSRGLTRRDFLLAGAGTGLYVLGLGGWAPGLREASASPLDLETFAQGYPRGLYFRQPEFDAASGEFTYAQWERRFLSLDGIVGKVMNEAVDYRAKNNRAWFLQYKRRNPAKMVLVHYNGTGRRGADEATTKFFAGHWLYYRGTRLSESIDEKTATFGVRNTSVFSMDRFRRVPDEIAIARVNSKGRPMWQEAEHVRLRAIDAANGTITVTRGIYSSRRLSFRKGSYVAAHVCTPYQFEDSAGPSGPLWNYNFATVGPRDARGRNGAEALADYLAKRLGPGGDLASLDGITFDVLSFGVRFGYPVNEVDVNNDGRADEGILGGVNVAGIGVNSFLKTLRERLPGKIISSDAHIPDESQRGFGYLNGADSEGYPDKYDPNLDELSRGDNIFEFWNQNSVTPSLHFMTYKYKDRFPEKLRNTFVEPNLSEDRSYKKLRLTLASAQFANAAFMWPPSWNPPENRWVAGNAMVRVFDELWRGKDQVFNWLGRPLGPDKRLALDAPDLLGGDGESWPDTFIGSFEGEEVSFTRAAGPAMVVRSTATGSTLPVLERLMTFRLPGIEPGINVTGEDLFVSLQLRADVPSGYPPSIARRVNVRANPAGAPEQGRPSFTWANGRSFTASFYFEGVGPGRVELSFKVEANSPVYLERLTAHSAADVRYREFEGGVVFFNPSASQYTFDLEQLFPGESFRRIMGHDNQDPGVNDGQPLGQQLILPANDALFVVREG